MMGLVHAHLGCPRSAIHGLDRWQLDLSTGLITMLEWLGLVTHVQRIAPETLARKRLG